MGGSGTVIAGNRILTNAHVVSDSTFIQVRKFGQAEKFKANVVAVSHESDLALLSVDDETFWENVIPVQLGGLPELQDNVFVCGYPEGGDNLSITKGVVSRIEHHYYAHSLEKFLAIQIDASVNSGNRGGAVISNGEIVGVVMQSLSDAQNTNYAIPTPLIQRFLTDLKDGKHDGIPKTSILMQSLESNYLKSFYGLPLNQTGVLVEKIIDPSTVVGLLEGDIIMTIDGHSIADDGTVEFRKDERTQGDYYVEQKQVGDTIRLGVFRGKAKTQVDIKLATGRYYRVYREQYDIDPLYYIFAGMVFAPLTINHMKLYGDNWVEEAPLNLLHTTFHKYWEEDKREAVMITTVLPDDINVGYHEMYDVIVEEVKGTTVRDLSHLISLINMSGDSSLVRIKLENGNLIVIDSKDAVKTHDDILERYGVTEGRNK